MVQEKKKMTEKKKEVGRDKLRTAFIVYPKER
jgi:hypothetical protein